MNENDQSILTEKYGKVADIFLVGDNIIAVKEIAEMVTMISPSVSRGLIRKIYQWKNDKGYQIISGHPVSVGGVDYYAHVLVKEKTRLDRRKDEENLLSDLHWDMNGEWVTGDQ